MTADGKVVIITELDTEGVATGSKRLKVEMESLGKEADSAEKEVDGLFGQLFKADFYSDIAIGALKELGSQLIEFVSESVGAAADVKAANAQFSQTFKELEKDATKSLESIEKQTGVTATRMQDSYTKIFAFTKSVGADSAEAMGIAERAMLAAADSAAYYDRSIEETTETLMSFIKGNYENDAALGIAATETTRNAEANRLYAKSFQELSESQKVDVLLSMVEAGNQASGALGQAAREADSWTNVTGEATEAWKQFQAVIGAPVLETLIPIIQNVTESLYDMIEGTESDKLSKNIKEFEKSLTSAEKKFDDTSKEIEANSLVAAQYLERLKELETAGLETAEAQQEYANIVALLNELMPELNLKIDEQTGHISRNTDAVLADIEALKQRAIAEAYSERQSEILKAQADAMIAVADAQKELTALEIEETTIRTQLAEVTARIQAGETGLIGKSRELSEALLSNTTQQSFLEQGIDETNKTISENDKLLGEIQKEIQNYSGELGDASDAQKEAATSAGEIQKALDELKEEYDSAKEAAKKSIDSQVGLFDELKISSKVTTEDILKNWESQKKGFGEYTANLQKAVDMGLDRTLVKQLSDGSVESMAILDALVNDTDTNVDEINAAFEKVSESRDTVADTMAGVQTDMMDKLGEIAADADQSWSEMSGTVEETIAEMQSYIDSLHGKTVYVDVVTRNKTASGTSSDSSMHQYEKSTYSIESVSLPHLASGAVIPPNAPFMAVLGDQRHGTNIEAPLATIQEAVRSELGGMMPGFETLAERIDLLIQTVQGIEIGDTVIGEAVARYQKYINMLRGGTT